VEVNTVFVLHGPMDELGILIVGEFCNLGDIDVKLIQDLGSFQEKLRNSPPGVLYVLMPGEEVKIDVVVSQTDNGCMVIDPADYCARNVPPEVIAKRWCIDPAVDEDGFLRLIKAARGICCQDPGFYPAMVPIVPIDLPTT
jgi:hypothetical protein